MKLPGLRTLVSRQTDQIADLQLQLEGSLTYNSRLNVRLSAALDALDTLHAELDVERRKNDKHLWMNLVQELQREKDEMKEVVELLIRNVERSKGNFDRWPSAMMYLPCPAGRSARSMDSKPAPIAPPRTEAILHALALERGRCRQASEALQNAHETILTLEAQVARREAELEACDRKSITDVRPIPPKRSILEALHPNLPEVSPSEMVHSLDIAEQNNCILEQEVSELNDLRLRNGHLPRFVSAGVQTLPPEPETPHPPSYSPLMTPARLAPSAGEVGSGVEDLRIQIQLLSDAIHGFEREIRTTRGAVESRRKPADTRSDPSSPSPLVSDDRVVSHIPQSPHHHQPPLDPPSPLPSPQRTPPDFKHILRLEDECLRLTHTNERLERELAELRAATSSPSRTPCVPFFRSPAHRSPALPTVSPSGFSVRSTGERDMDISSTPLRSSTSLPDNRLSDFDLFLGHADDPAANNSSMNPEPPGNDTMNPESPEAGSGDSKDRPSSAPLENTHLSVLLSPFQLSTSLPPRSQSAEPPSGPQNGRRKLNTRVSSEGSAPKGP